MRTKSSIKNIINVITLGCSKNIYDSEILMGQLKDFLRLGNTISSFGIENGIIKYTSEFEKKEKDLSKIIGSSFKINFFL